MDGEGLRGELSIFQRSRFEPTWLNFAIKSAANSLRTNLEYAKNIASFAINELPPTPSHAADNDYCSTSGNIYDPTKLHGHRIPPPGFGTQEQYKVGDLSGKLKGRNKREQHDFLLSDGSNELNGIYWDLFLPLSGPSSIVNRGFIANRVNRTNPLNISESIWTCGVISLFEFNQVYQMPIQTAEVLFRYPIVGKILFRQPKEDPTLDTTIIVEYLIHADGANVNNSIEHRWSINVEPPGKDFYDWQNRCKSVGDVFNPHKISYDLKEPEKTCSMSNNNLCRIGDLANRLGTLEIAGGVADAKISRKMFTDSNLPLSGFGSILGKSVTIYDDHGPVARGERLACALYVSFIFITYFLQI